jgi:hypothetical protein
MYKKPKPTKIIDGVCQISVTAIKLRAIEIKLRNLFDDALVL